MSNSLSRVFRLFFDKLGGTIEIAPSTDETMISLVVKDSSGAVIKFPDLDENDLTDILLLFSKVETDMAQRVYKKVNPQTNTDVKV